MRLVDLSHVVEAGMQTFPGLPGPVICDYLSREASRGRYAPGTEFHIGRIDMVANTGTYVDAPFHRYDGAADLADLPLERLADLPGVVIEARRLEVRAIGAGALAGHDVRGRAVLLRTGWDRWWGTAPYAVGSPFLSRAGAEWLRDAGAVLVGIDAVNVDDMDDWARPAHTVLLAAGIPIAEHLRGLDQLPASGFRFSAVPVKVRGMGTFPVRAYAVVDA
ncbi:MAG TPA: cyclase family protein [Gemmatimonadaceae bacterium]|nr:cyclase family protein [Gemmatimonadaceae bacterium]